MFRTLRNRLILSHALPLLVIIPVVGLLLIYVLETGYFIPNITRNLEGDARLVAALVGGHPELWEDHSLMQALLSHLNPDPAERIQLLSLRGQLLASTDLADADKIDQQVEITGLPEVLNGQEVSSRSFSQQLQEEVIEVSAPVIGEDGKVAGIVRLTYSFDTAYAELLHLRFLMGAVLFIGLLFGVALGLILAVNISDPIGQVTQAVEDLASGRRSELLPEKGAEEIRQLQRAANNLFTRLRELEEARHQLLANLVHELGRPMGALLAAIQALRRGAKEDPQLMDELLQGMEDEAIRLQRLTEELTDLHEQVLGTLTLDFQQVDLAVWLPRALLPWREKAQAARLSWAVEIPAGLPNVCIDPDRFDQVIGNLVSNAIKYTQRGGRILISAGWKEGEAWVQVSDTGPGIPYEDQEKLFTPFFRGEQSRRFPQGMGLGLSIARDLVRAHGGRIEVGSTPGIGSEFTIWLPKAD
jgi:signal transduction histidine kinase